MPRYFLHFYIFCTTSFDLYIENKGYACNFEYCIYSFENNIRYRKLVLAEWLIYMQVVSTKNFKLQEDTLFK